MSVLILGCSTEEDPINDIGNKIQAAMTPIRRLTNEVFNI